MARNPFRLSRSVQFQNGNAVQTVYGNQSRVVVTATSSSSAEQEIPGGARAIEVRSTVDVWIRFGNTGVGDAAADADSILFPAGEKFLMVPLDSNDAPFDFFKVLRAGSDSGVVQVEAVNMQE